MDAALRAGIALHNAGDHHAAHDPWEERWLALDDGTADARLLQGLIQFAAAVHHARNRNWSGATGLATSAGDYLAGLESPSHGVDVEGVRRALATLAADPEVIERRRPPLIGYEGRALSPADLDFEATALAARALAADRDAEATMDAAVEYAREEVETGDRTLFTALLFDFVAGEDPHRDLVARRLRRHVDRRNREYDDVAGLFD